MGTSRTAAAAARQSNTHMSYQSPAQVHAVLQKAPELASDTCQAGYAVHQPPAPPIKCHPSSAQTRTRHDRAAAPSYLCESARGLVLQHETAHVPSPGRRQQQRPTRVRRPVPRAPRRTAAAAAATDTTTAATAGAAAASACHWGGAVAAGTAAAAAARASEPPVSRLHLEPQLVAQRHHGHPVPAHSRRPHAVGRVAQPTQHQQQHLRSSHQRPALRHWTTHWRLAVGGHRRTPGEPLACCLLPAPILSRNP